MSQKTTLAQRRADYRLHQMSPVLDISVGAIPQHRYCIASTPRSGSTLISRMLLASKLAGDPKEYLNPLLIQAWHEMNQRTISISDYIKELEARRTSQNGFFGIKVHGRHLVELSKRIKPKEIDLLIHNFDKFIFVTRKDKINQAISYFIARTTGVFHFDQERWLQELDIPDPIFRAEEILLLLSDLLRQEEIWEKILQRSKKPVYRVVYEDFFENYEEKSKEIFDFLGVAIAEIPSVPTKPMNKRSTTEFRDLLLHSMGLKFDALSSTASTIHK